MLRVYTLTHYRCLAFGSLLLLQFASYSSIALETDDQALCTVKSDVWLKRDGEILDLTSVKNTETFVIKRASDTIEFLVRPRQLTIDTTLPFKISKVLGGEITAETSFSKLVYDDGVLMYTTTAYSQIKALVAHCKSFKG